MKQGALTQLAVALNPKLEIKFAHFKPEEYVSVEILNKHPTRDAKLFAVRIVPPKEELERAEAAGNNLEYLGIHPHVDTVPSRDRAAIVLQWREEELECLFSKYHIELVLGSDERVRSATRDLSHLTTQRLGKRQAILARVLGDLQDGPGNWHRSLMALVDAEADVFKSNSDIVWLCDELVARSKVHPFKEFMENENSRVAANEWYELLRASNKTG